MNIILLILKIIIKIIYMEYLIYGLSKIFDWFGLIKSPAKKHFDQWYS